MIKVKFENLEEEPELPEQEYTSADTSINQIPALFNIVNFEKGTVNLDVGGGKYDKATDYLETLGVTNLVFDPYNRTSEHNNSVIKTVRENGGADTVTCANVLNVIAEYNARQAVIKNCYRYLKNGSPAYFMVYEGKDAKNSAAGPTSKGYQLRAKTDSYVDEIKEVFGNNVNKKGKLIVAIK